MTTAGAVASITSSLVVTSVSENTPTVEVAATSYVASANAVGIVSVQVPSPLSVRLPSPSL